MIEDVTFEGSVELLHPGPNALAATREALGRMTPFLCRSVRRIVFGRVPEHRDTTGAVNSFGSGDMVLINLAHRRFWEEDLAEKRSSQLMLQGTLIHEAAHAAETLLGAESKDGGPRAGSKRYAGSWDLRARNAARGIIQSARLEKGFYDEWQRMHRSFVQEKWAERYDNDGYEKTLAFLRDRLDVPPRFANASPERIANAGFMNRYGASNWAEDIATYIGSLYIGPEMAAGISNAGGSDDLREDTACRVLQGQQSRNVPAKLAAVYAKLMFLRDVGLVAEDDVKKCTGSSFGLMDVSGQGFFVFEKGSLKRSMKSEVQAGMGRKGVGNVFEMRSEGDAMFGGKSYPASMKLSLAVGVGPIEDASWPRGAYKLGIVGPNNFALRLEGAKAGNFITKDAYVFVGSSTDRLISGSIFITQAWRAEAPIPVPQVFNPPLQIRFQLMK